MDTPVQSPNQTTPSSAQSSTPITASLTPNSKIKPDSQEHTLEEPTSPFHSVRSPSHQLPTFRSPFSSPRTGYVQHILNTKETMDDSPSESEDDYEEEYDHEDENDQYDVENEDEKDDEDYVIIGKLKKKARSPSSSTSSIHSPIPPYRNNNRPHHNHHHQVKKKRFCEFCGTADTPMWRRGPQGKGNDVH